MPMQRDCGCLRGESCEECSPRHSCIRDDGGTPNRRCPACAREKERACAAEVKQVRPKIRLMGLHEVGQLTGLPQHTLRNWGERGNANGFPRPLAVLVGGRVWDASEVEEWWKRFQESR